MARKVLKAKSSNLKNASSKKQTEKVESKEKLSNGIDNNNEKEKITEHSDEKMEVTETQEAGSSKQVNDTESKSSESNEQAEAAKAEVDESDEQKGSTAQEKDDEMQVEESEAPESKTVEMEEVASSSKAVSKPRKRKAAPKKEPATKTKAKKQRVLLEIPKISSVSGKVFVIGDNTVGQLGLGEDITEKKRPALLDLPHSIVDVAAGGMHSVCLTESGEVITFGCNDEGALGRPTTEEGSEFIPKKIDIAERIVQVSAGDSHSAALSESGHVYIWGNFRNNNGPMGLVTESVKQVTPVRILNDVTVVKIASGSDHLACLSQEGVVYTCGNGEVGQLGRVSEHASVDGGRKGRTLLLSPDEVPVAKSGKPCLINNVWTGSFATFVSIRESGSIYAFGLNNYNQLGLKNQNTVWKPKQVTSFSSRTWTQINGGQHHTLALDNDGLVYSLGRSEYGRLGLGESSEEVSVPTIIPALQSEKCTDVSCGNCVSYALTENGSVFSWGMGTNYQLGHGNDDDKHIPVQIEGKFFDSWKAVKVAGGGQHTLIIANPKNSSEKTQ